EHGVTLKYRGALKLAADAALSDLVFRQVSEVRLAAYQKHTAFVGPCLAGDDIHQRGLARSVRTDDAPELAVVQNQGELVERFEPVAAHAHTVDAKQRMGSLGDRYVATCPHRSALGPPGT